MAPRLRRKIYAASRVYFSAWSYLFACRFGLKAEDAAEAVYSEAKTRRTKDGTTINYALIRRIRYVCGANNKSSGQAIFVSKRFVTNA